MKGHHPMRIFCMYFKDFFQWICLVSFVFFGSFFLVIFLDGWQIAHFLIIAVWAIYLLLFAHYIRLCISAYKEISLQLMAQKKITVSAVDLDNLHTLQTHTGSLVGNAKLTVTDTDSEIYLLCLPKNVWTLAGEILVGKTYDCSYLPKSRLLLSLDPCTDNIKKRYVHQFMKSFFHIFQSYIPE